VLTSSQLFATTTDFNDSEDLIPPTMLAVSDEGGPGRSVSSTNVQHFSNLASDRAVSFEVPQLVGATAGLRNDHIAGTLLHFQHTYGQKDSTLQHFSCFV